MHMNSLALCVLQKSWTLTFIQMFIVQLVHLNYSVVVFFTRMIIVQNSASFFSMQLFKTPVVFPAMHLLAVCLEM